MIKKKNSDKILLWLFVALIVWVALATTTWITVAVVFEKPIVGAIILAFGGILFSIVIAIIGKSF